jgi:phosphatidylglycerophosphatase A
VPVSGLTHYSIMRNDVDVVPRRDTRATGFMTSGKEIRCGEPQPNAGGAPAWATLVATFFAIGYMRPGPGSWASAATTLLWFALGSFIPGSWRANFCTALAAVVVLIGIPAATRVARATGIEDPQFVVIDEVAGQLITLIGVPLSWKSLLAGFILFRVFDTIKPPPVRQLERIPDGAGIVLDDVAAGIGALIIMHLLVHFCILIP